VARLVVASHADLCSIDVLDDEGRAERVAGAWRDPRPSVAAEGAHATHGVRPTPAAAEPGLAMPHGTALRELARQVLDTGEPVLRLASATADGGQSTGPAPVGADSAAPLTSAIGVPLVARGRVLGAMVLGTMRRRAFDRTDLTLAEELARRAAAAIDNARLYHEARQAVAARDGVLAIVSHDLRNPVLAVSMVADALRGLLPEGQGQEYIAMIKRTMAEMDRLIEDLLDVAKIEAGHLRIEPEPHSAADLVAEAVELLRPVAVERSQILEVSVAEDLPAVHADRSRVLQVLSNLVGNAVKFSPEGGRITLHGVANGDEVRFSVADSGPGIPEEHLPRIFDRFWQARHVRRGGAGLGLSIARGIVEAHGGRIWVESPPGAGAIFHFTLPLATATRASA
jgi:signal transduction histidine kinase